MDHWIVLFSRWCACRLAEYFPDNQVRLGHFAAVSLLALLPPDRQSVVEAWLQVLEGSSKTTDRIVAHHWRTDAHLPSEAAAALADVVERCSSGGGCQLLSKVPDRVWMLSASVRPVPAGETMLVRFCQLNRLKYFIRDGSGVIEACATPEAVELAIQNLEVEQFEGVLRGAGPINWCSPASDISPDATADDVRAQLGLSRFTLVPSAPKPLLEEVVIELRYPADLPASLHVPTVAEAAGYEPFLPAPSPAASGFTQHLATGESSHREFVHGPIPAKALTEVRSRGRLQSDPPDDWIKVRLDSIPVKQHLGTS